MRRSTFLRAGVAGVLLSTLNVRASTANTLSVAIVPQFSAVELQKAWTPLLEKVQTVTGIELRMLTYASIPRFERDFLEGVPDLVFMNPYHAVMAWRAKKYVPLVRDGEKPLTGILVCAQGDGVRTVGDLQGKRIAFPAPNAFGASLYMRALLTEVHHLRFEAAYVKTHTNAYRHVLTGEAQGAGGIRATFEREPAQVRDLLTIMFETPAVAAHPLAAHPRVAASQRQALQDAFLSEASTPEGLALLKPTTLARPVAADYGRDYAPLERLNLARYAVVEKD